MSSSDTPATGAASRVVVVTGSTHGLGFGLARALMMRGYAVMVSARHGAEAETAAAALRGAGVGARLGWAACDVRDPAQLEALWAKTEASLGTPSVWINNAGVALGGRTLQQTSSEELRAMAEVNLLGTMNGCRVAATRMGALGGAIYNIHGAGSDGRPVPGMIGYATTKRAVQFFTHALAQELDPARIIVCGISPGLVMTEGFFREHARVPAGERAAREAAVDLLGDHVETVATWAADVIEMNRESGQEFVWLTPDKLDARRRSGKPRHILQPYRDAGGALPGGDHAG